MYTKNVLMIITIILFGISNVYAQEWSKGVSQTEYKGNLDYSEGKDPYISEANTTFAIEKEGSSYKIVGKYTYEYNKKWAEGKLENVKFINKDELITKL